MKAVLLYNTNSFVFYYILISFKFWCMLHEDGVTDSETTWRRNTKLYLYDPKMLLLVVWINNSVMICTDINLQALKTTRNRRQDRQFPEWDSNPEPPEHKARVQTIVPRYSARWASQDLNYAETIRCGKPLVETLIGDTGWNGGSEKYVTEFTGCTLIQA
jgi:hypothetical protein